MIEVAQVRGLRRPEHPVGHPSFKYLLSHWSLVKMKIKFGLRARGDLLKAGSEQCIESYAKENGCWM